MGNSLSRKQIQSIAYRIKYICSGCPEFISYYDIKDELAYGSYLRKVLSDTKTRDDLFSSESLSAEILEILCDLEKGLDEWDRRRIALFHGAVQFPARFKSDALFSLNEKLNELDSDNQKNEYSYIFLCSLLDRVHHVNEMPYRKKLMVISNILEGDDPEDSLYAHFKKLISLSIRTTRVTSNSIEGGGYSAIPRKEALTILFDFEDYDFQDKEFVGGSKFLDKTAPMSLRKKIILQQLEELRGMNLKDSLEFFN